MNIHYLISCVTVTLFACVTSHAQEFEMAFSSNGELVATSVLTISEGIATVTSGDENETFDLKGMRWQREDSGDWVTLKQCELWAKKTKKMSENSKVELPEKVRAFAAWSIDPAFDITLSDNILDMKSDHVHYKISVSEYKGNGDYFSFAKLNSYKKAMVLRKLAPFAELVVLDELAKRKLFFDKMDIEIIGIPGAPSLSITITEKNEK